jgi:hypothetical protein
MLIDGVWAEVIVNGEHLRLFSEHNALGVQTSVYNVTTKSWIAPSEPVDDIEQGKERAAEYARAFLKRAANADLPALEWKKARSRLNAHRKGSKLGLLLVNNRASICAMPRHFWERSPRNRSIRRPSSG